MNYQMSLPRVTVLLANYNDEDYIVKAYNSAVKQDYEGSLCVCIIDDGSTDGSWDRIEGIFNQSVSRRQDGEVEILSDTLNLKGEIKKRGLVTIKKPNGGPSDARNEGIKHTFESTDIYAVLDSDDEMKPNKITKCVDIMLEDMDRIGAVYADYDTYTINTDKMIREFKEPFSRRRLVEECIVHSGSIINKKALIDVKEDTGYYDKTMRVCEDYDLWMRISEKYMIVHIPESLTLVRVTGDNSSFVVNKDIWEQNWKKIRDKLYARANEKI